MHSITAIEDAILASLEPLKASLRVRQVAPYAGEIEPEKIKAFKARPFLLVTFNGVPGVADHGSRRIEATRWLILAGDSDRVDLAKARRGGATNPGTYTMLAAVRQALEGQQLLQGLFPVQRLGEETLINEAGMSVYACHYEISQGYLV